MMLSCWVLLSLALLATSTDFPVLKPASERRCEKGQWKQLQSLAELPTLPHFARTTFNPQSAKASGKSWLDSACPTQSFMYSCYYHEGHPNSTLPRDYAESAEQRLFQHDDPYCLSFHGHDFLELLRGRRLLVVGDSISQQHFQSLVCQLHRITPLKAMIPWEYIPKNYAQFDNGHMCPFWTAHCYVMGGIDVIARGAGVSIHFRHLNMYHNGSFWGMVSDLRLTDRDLVLFNMGIHHNTADLYVNQLEDFLDNLSLVRHHNPRAPHVVFVESTPQHFPTEAGNYDPRAAGTKRCGIAGGDQLSAAAMEERMRRGDWRNRVASELIDSFNNGSRYRRSGHTNHLRVVRIAQALYSQWDAHIDNAPMHWVPVADCTHYCMPSAVFAYMHTMVFNALLDELGQRPDAPLVPLRDYSSTPLVKGSGKSCYLVRNGTRYDFGGLASFVAMGFDFDQVVTIPDYELEEIPYGGTI